MDNFIFKNVIRLKFKVQDTLAFQEGPKEMLEHTEPLSGEMKMMTIKSVNVMSQFVQSWMCNAVF